MEGCGHHVRLKSAPSTPVVHSLEDLCRRTKFSRKEIQLMYRSFKQECPSGYVAEDTFRLIFSHFFPYGNASSYAHYVFRTFDQNRNGAITFKDFIQCLSLMMRGSLQEKLEWAFRLYDLNGDGRITKKELTDIICSVYALMGRRSFSGAEEKALREHVDKTFMNIGWGGFFTQAIISKCLRVMSSDNIRRVINEKMDINKDGVVTMDEFMEICNKDEVISQSLTLFDTVL